MTFPETRNYPKHNFEIPLLVTIFLLITYLRSPEITTHGRFFAEEGAMFWAHALQVPWYRETIFVAPITGYFLLITNLVTSVSSHLPLLFAPLFSVWISLAIQVLPSVIVLNYTPKKFLKFKVVWAYLLIIALPATNGEVFGNSINSQVFLGVTTFVIIVLNSLRSMKKPFVIFILVISCLSGWYSIALLPALLLDSWKQKNFRENLLFISIFVSSALLQIIALVYSKTHHLISPDRFSPELSINSNLRNLKEIARLSIEGDIGIPKFALLFLVGSLVLFSLLLNILRANFIANFEIYLPSRIFLISCVSFLSEYFLILTGRVSNSFAGRYSVLPGILLFSIFLIIAYSFGRFSFFRIPLFIFVLVSGLLYFTLPRVGYLTCSEGCLTWRQQVNNLAQHKSNEILHWPMLNSQSPWKTNMSNPQVSPSPEQIKLLQVYSR